MSNRRIHRATCWLTVAGVALVGSAGPAAAAAADDPELGSAAGCSTAGSQTVCKFTVGSFPAGYTPSYLIPAGVSEVRVDAIGGFGGGGNGALIANRRADGGRSARVSATLAVDEGDTFSFALGAKGGDGTNTASGAGGVGFQNGKAGGLLGGAGSAGGGGGATGVLVNRAAVVVAVVVAGGGGGGGGNGTTGFSLLGGKGGDGGDAGVAGQRGENGLGPVLFPGTPGTGGFPGSAGAAADATEGFPGLGGGPGGGGGGGATPAGTAGGQGGGTGTAGMGPSAAAGGGGGGGGGGLSAATVGADVSSSKIGLGDMGNGRLIVSFSTGGSDPGTTDPECFASGPGSLCIEVLGGTTTTTSWSARPIPPGRPHKGSAPLWVPLWGGRGPGGQ